MIRHRIGIGIDIDLGAAFTDVVAQINVGGTFTDVVAQNDAGGIAIRRKAQP